MSIFTDINEPALTPFRTEKGIAMSAAILSRNDKTSLRAKKGGLEALGQGSQTAIAAMQTTLANQFMVFQLNPKTEGPTILDSTQVQPLVDGSDDDPDVLIAAEMLSFHVADNESIDKDARATLRMNFGKDESSTNKKFDAVFWSVAAGLNLYNDATKKTSEAKDLKSDFQKAFSGRPIEIPGGLGRISFDVVKHKEPQWWKRIFSFAQSGTGRALISTLGFPAITNQAIGALDQLLEKLNDSTPEILFKGRPMVLAFSSYARDAFSGGNARIKVGCLNRGFAIFVRGRDFDTIAKSNATYVPGYDKLVPADVSPSDLLSGNYNDPFKNVTYAIFRIGTKKTRLDPTFQFGS